MYVYTQIHTHTNLPHKCYNYFMRIFLCTATKNINKNFTPVDKIYQLVLKKGHTHTASWFTVNKNKLKAIPPTLEMEINLKEEIIKSDLMLVEISIPSLGVGFHTCLAKMYRIPTVCLYHSKYKHNVSSYFKAITDNKLFLLLEYNDSNLEKVLTHALQKLTPKKTRFNFNLNPQYYQYLNILAKDHNKTITDILHELIAEKIERSNSKSSP